MTRLDRVLELLDNYDIFAGVCVESFGILSGAKFLADPRKEKDQLTQELIEHGCRRKN